MPGNGQRPHRRFVPKSFYKSKTVTDRFYSTNSEIELVRPLWEQGVLVAERNGDFYKTELYQLDGGYFEVVWHTHFNVVIKVTAFSDTERLEPFLSDISIAGLFA